MKNYAVREFVPNTRFNVAISKVTRPSRCPLRRHGIFDNDSQRGLSDEARSRLVMSTEWGKLEIVSVLDDACTAALPNSSYSGRADVPGLVVFKLYRSPSTAIDQGALLIARRNPAARWITGYTDRIVYDGRHEANRASTSQTA